MTEEAFEDTSTPETILANRSDFIRSVPISMPEQVAKVVAEGIPAAAPPHLTYRGGPLLTNVEVFAIFWGQNWPRSEMTHLEDFLKTLVTTSEMAFLDG